MIDFAKLLREGPPPLPVVPRLCLGVTGHRPHKLPDPATGYDWNNPLRRRLRLEMTATTRRLVDAAASASPSSLRSQLVDRYLSTVTWRSGFTYTADTVLGFSGVALGIDQDICGVWARMSLPYVAVVPFQGQEARWPQQAQQVFAAVLAHAAGVVVVSSTRPRDDAEAATMLKRRNEWLSVVSDEMIAVWDGSRGGTSAAVRLFESGGKRVVRIDPRNFY